MSILDDMARLVERVRTLDRAEVADELSRLLEKVRTLDRGELVEEVARLVERVSGLERSELMEEVQRVADRVRDVIHENQALKSRLKARLQAARDELPYPYEGIYWFDSPANG